MTYDEIITKLSELATYMNTALELLENEEQFCEEKALKISEQLKRLDLYLIAIREIVEQAYVVAKEYENKEGN
jgi:hypothetical protein